MVNNSTLTGSLYKALKRYINTLKQVGYISGEETKKALIASYIDDLFSPEWALYITEEDERILNNIIMCIIRHSCLFKDANINYDINTPLYNVSGVFRSVDSDSEEYLQVYNQAIKYRN